MFVRSLFFFKDVFPFYKCEYEEMCVSFLISFSFWILLLSFREHMYTHIMILQILDV